MGMFNPLHPGALIADILENGNLSVGNSVTADTRKSRTRNPKMLRQRLSLQFKRDLWLASRKRRKKVKSVVTAGQSKALKCAGAQKCHRQPKLLG